MTTSNKANTRKATRTATPQEQSESTPTKSSSISDTAKAELAALLLPVDPNQIVTYNPTTRLIYINGELIDDMRRANLAAEAEFFIASDLWKVMNESLKQLLQEAMFVHGESLEDMRKGRAGLFILDAQKNMIQKLRSR